MATKMKQSMAELNKMWQNRTATHGPQDLPEGEYEAKIVAAVLTASKKTSDAMVVWDIKVTSGEKKGKTVKLFRSLKDQDATDRFTGDLDTLGISLPEDLTDKSMGKMLESTVDIAVVLKARRADESTFYDIVDVLGDKTEKEDEAEETEEKDADDEPKGKGKSGKSSKSDDEVPSKDEIKEMSKGDLKKLAKSADIDLSEFDLDDAKDVKKARLQIIDELGL